MKIEIPDNTVTVVAILDNQEVEIFEMKKDTLFETIKCQWETYLKEHLDSNDQIIKTCVNYEVLNKLELIIQKNKTDVLMFSNAIKDVIDKNSNINSINIINNKAHTYITMYSIVKSDIKLFKNYNIEFYRLFTVVFNPSVLQHANSCYMYKYDIEFDRCKTLFGEIEFSV